ncbi:Hypothetical predicted protein [Octopus vulgaris]|uniref:Uncharacterized protein n=2 Tax=Octopus TaxID=6643 RepID=A0AA36BPJ1_OCTVU|nr:uncharacterized protein LOC115222870 isoform X2 [Octopus sinensis]XP_036367831.1 uncharacterized protein LOC115222870 isoform X2 [Octopus sinensis]XP_036367832.1 uncharacterized protein LOC115222870 isoform X2 [Octopus sinensis]CAI9738220.1 Hypothetical predicted protein [Octopus vulgaris]
MSVSDFIDRQTTGDLDLYDDILEEDFACEKESLAELQQKYQEALQKIATLENTVKERTAAMELLEKKNVYLQKNISMLYKTACTEIKRKNDNIESLREQLESYEKENYLKKRQSGYSKWNGDYQSNSKPSQTYRRNSYEKEKSPHMYSF